MKILDICYGDTIEMQLRLEVDSSQVARETACKGTPSFAQKLASIRRP